MTLKTYNQKGSVFLFWLFSWAVFYLPNKALAQGTTITNPIGSNSFETLFENLANGIRTIAIPFAVVIIIYLGFRFVFESARGNIDELQKVKALFWYIIIGVIVIVAGSLLVQAIAGFVRQL